eukprot:TRINITY_DN24911_c0_g1_i1.p2 TRINITY_DN24911_c0_g1~~TRINITY_DN24911_c0_g1_i1.p2  ORF type:complete len:136 (-),score=10.24 TRINITY_DN24911_c0_g1_i1:404-811(-)
MIAATQSSTKLFFDVLLSFSETDNSGVGSDASAQTLPPSTSLSLSTANSAVVVVAVVTIGKGSAPVDDAPVVVLLTNLSFTVSAPPPIVVIVSDGPPWKAAGGLLITFGEDPIISEFFDICGKSAITAETTVGSS